MKITRANYEVYFLDYLEGNLDDHLVDDFIEFLQENPDLKEELQLVNSITLEPESLVFKNKKKLYKERYDIEEEFEKAAVALLEGDLPEEEKAEFKAFLSAHPEKQRDFILFQKTILQPDSPVVFPNKSRLYRSTSGKTVLLWMMRIAAVLAVAFLVYRFADNVLLSRMQPENQSAFTENKKENTEPGNIPAKAEKQEDPVPVKEETQSPVKTSKPKTQPHKSLRESNRGRIDHEKVANIRIPAEVPEKIPALQVSLKNNERIAASLIPVPDNKVDLPAQDYEERLFADLVKEKTRLDNLSLNVVAKAGLSLVSGFSREKFKYETNSNGQITELKFDSRLLAFSIPTNQD